MPTLNHPPDGPVEEENQPGVTMRCPFCGVAHPTTRVRFGSYYHVVCRSCDSVWYPCNGYNHLRYTVPIMEHSEEICSECASVSGIRQCEQCRAYSMRTTSNGLCVVCRQTHRRCSDCEEIVLIANMVLSYTGQRICRECDEYRRSTGNCTCELCTSGRLDNPAYSEFGDPPPRDPASINAWNYRPTLEFHGDGPLFLGMELELETGDYRGECAEVIRSYLRDVPNLAYLKSDGSIEHGFELVTHPMSYGWAIENFPWQMIPDLETAGAHTHSRVGMHVHLSRAGFIGPTHVYKWMKFIYRNSASVTKIARREAFDWAAFDPDDRRNIKHYAKGVHGGARYRAINTQNKDTFEFRVFRSTTNVQQIQAALGLSAASVAYTKDLSTTDVLKGGWEWRQFADWLEQHPEFTPLRNEMEVQGCVS